MNELFSEVKTSYYRDHNHKSSPLHWWQLTSRPGSEGILEEQRLQLHKLAFEQFHRPGTCSVCESEKVKVWKWKCERESVKVKVWKAKACIRAIPPSGNMLSLHNKKYFRLLETMGLLYWTHHDDDICTLHGIDLRWVNGPFLRAGLKVLQVSLYPSPSGVCSTSVSHWNRNSTMSHFQRLNKCRKHRKMGTIGAN